MRNLRVAAAVTLLAGMLVPPALAGDDQLPSGARCGGEAPSEVLCDRSFQAASTIATIVVDVSGLTGSLDVTFQAPGGQGRARCQALPDTSLCSTEPPPLQVGDVVRMVGTAGGVAVIGSGQWSIRVETAR